MLFRQKELKGKQFFRPFNKSEQSGFSLIEVMITFFIIAIVTVMVIVKHSSFNSTVLLKNQAYDMALAIREAQSFSINAKTNRTGGFRQEYGMYFDLSLGPAKQYQLFLDSASPSLNNNGMYDNGEGVVISTVDSRFEITNLCVLASGGNKICSGNSNVFNQISISFVRPNFDAVFKLSKNGSLVLGTYTALSIEITPVDGGSIKRYIIVRSTGQISVQNNSNL